MDITFSVPFQIRSRIPVDMALKLRHFAFGHCGVFDRNFEKWRIDSCLLPIKFGKDEMEKLSYALK